MAHTPSVLASAVDTGPPPTPMTHSPTYHGTLAVQAGGSPAQIQCQYLRPPEAPARPSRERVSGAWDAVLSLFRRRNTPPLKRCASSDLHTGPDKPPREDDGRVVLASHEQDALTQDITTQEPTALFPLLDLPFELLCEVMARVPAEDRYFILAGSPLAATCKAIHRALKTVSTMPQYRDEDLVARRIAGLRSADQVVATTDAVAKLPPSRREWAIKAMISMARAMTVQGRQTLISAVLDHARQHSELWALELMRYFARWIPHTDHKALDMLTELALAVTPSDDEVRFARLRVLAQLAQRISPDDMSGSIRRWESIYQAMSAEPRDEDYVTWRALRQSLRHLRNDSQATFTIANPTELLLSIVNRLETSGAEGSEPSITACSTEERDYVPAPALLPDTVPMIDSLRAYSRVMSNPVPRADRLPAHMM